MVDVKFRGEDKKATTARTMVKLYFCDVKYAEEFPSYANQRYYVRQVAYALPALGEFIEVSAIVALDMIDKTRFQGRSLLITEQDGGAQLSALIKDAQKSGRTLTELELQKSYTVRALDKFTDEELREILQSRQIVNTVVPVQPVSAPFPKEKGDNKDK